MRAHIIKTLVITAAMAVASIASADNWVHVNFGAIKIDLVGPAGGAGEPWNQAGTAKSGTDLLGSAGAATTIDWSISAGLSAGDWNSANTLERLESAFCVQDSNTRTLKISGLNPARLSADVTSFTLVNADIQPHNPGQRPGGPKVITDQIIAYTLITERCP